MVEFGKRLKELRTQAKLTQQQLGELVGVTKSVVSFYELQERAPSPEVLIKLAGIFHVSTDYLLGLEKGITIDVTGLDSDEIALISELVRKLRKNKPNTSNR